MAWSVQLSLIKTDKDVYITMHLAFKELIKTDKDVYIKCTWRSKS